MKSEAIKASPSGTAQAARAALAHLNPLARRRGPARFRVQREGDTQEAAVSLPREAFELLLEALGQMADGNSVAVVPMNAELTTHEAAELLNVSRPYLIGLLESGKIPHRKVGTHRRVRFSDLMAYKKRDDHRRDEVLAELTRQSEDLDLGY